jgi:hypothetical protein
MEIIVFEKETYYKMLAEFKATLKDALKEMKSETAKASSESWIDAKEAQSILKCKCDKLRHLRDTEKIKVSIHGRKILYHKPSIYQFLESNINSYYHAVHRK